MSFLATSLPHSAILSAIEQGQFHVTVGDVASETGLDLWRVERDLMALALVVGAHLRVKADGEVIYVFPRNLRTIRFGRAWVRRLREGVRIFWKWIFYLFRLSFGIVLIGLIVSVLSALAAVFLLVFRSGSGEHSDQDVSSFSSSSSSTSIQLFPFDFGVWLDADPWWQRGTTGSQQDRCQERGRSGEKVGFLQAIFSFLFGDGNPNWNLEERRWRTIASLIRRHDGVIVVEQLMPYLDEFHRSSLDEEAVLSTLLRFNGRPHVSPEGDLVYAFPELQVTAQDRRGSGSSPPGISLGRHSVPSGEASLDGESGAMLPYLRELPWRFSEATPAQQTTAVLLGIVLLIISLFLRRAVVVSATSLGVWSSWFSALALLGLAYGSAFLLLPFVRWLWLCKRNLSLRRRNATRWQRAQRLQHGSSALRRKLAYAAAHAGQQKSDSENLAYTTERDLLAQEVENAIQADAEWRRGRNGSPG